VKDRDRLSADDAHILSVESAVIMGHTLKLVVLEPDADGPLDLDALRTAVAQRLPRQVRATQRVDTSGPEPRWVQATDFDIADHIRRRNAPDCFTPADLWRTVSALMSEHLDRERPLWTFDLIGPLADGREAIAARIHHAMADGISAITFLHELLWDPHVEPPRKGPRPGVRPEAKPSPLGEALRMPEAVHRELGHRGSRSPFDLPISASRELAFAVAPLDELKAIGRSRPTHATVNDVLLAIIASGLGTWLAGRGEPVPRLRAQIPVSLHHRDEGTTELGNRDSFLNIDLPIGESDPLAQLDRISAETRERKRLDDAEELYDLFHALGRVKRVGEAARRLAGSAREFSVSISNVPGPSIPVGVAGRRVEHLFTSSEPAAHHALRISAISCAGVVGIGLCTVPEALPDVASLAVAIERGHAELRSAAMG
jgi:diacylglycerol O-acyltransferase